MYWFWPFRLFSVRSQPRFCLDGYGRDGAFWTFDVLPDDDWTQHRVVRLIPRTRTIQYILELKNRKFIGFLWRLGPDSWPLSMSRTWNWFCQHLSEFCGHNREIWIWSIDMITGSEDDCVSDFVSAELWFYLAFWAWTSSCCHSTCNWLLYYSHGQSNLHPYSHNPRPMLLNFNDYWVESIGGNHRTGRKSCE